MDTNSLGKLDPAFKAKWVAALRSGDYQQGTGALSVDGKFCCLGVACAITDIPLRTPDDHMHFILPPETHLSEIVKWWQTLPQDQCSTRSPDVMAANGVRMALSELNDSGKTFAEIADLIEAQL
jgi:hypothetical protein